MRKIVNRGMLPHRKSEEGFTLIELAIVMVIIGLLVGGVLRGQEMIQNARVSNTINSIDGYTSAVAMYTATYRAVPGDDGNAVARWAIENANAKGDGDSVIEGTYNDATAETGITTTNETRLFWLHLRNAGLVSGATNDSRQPPNPFGGIFGVVNNAFQTTAGTGGTDNPLDGHAICVSRVPGDQAQKIDARMDDGDPQAGILRAGDGESIASLTQDGTYVPGKNYTLCTRL